MDYDPLVVRLNKDISAIEEAMSASLQQHKFQYIFEGQTFVNKFVRVWLLRNDFSFLLQSSEVFESFRVRQEEVVSNYNRGDLDWI